MPRPHGRTLGLLLIIGLASLSAACRAERIWSGVQFQDDGTLKVVAEEPMCGCLSVVNTLNDDVRLTVIHQQESIGTVLLKPARRQRFRFDWGGAEREDFYEIRITDADGKPLDAQQAIEVEERPRWIECGDAVCDTGDLHMDAALKEQ